MDWNQDVKKYQGAEIGQQQWNNCKITYGGYILVWYSKIMNNTVEF